MKKYLLPIALILGPAMTFAADQVPAFPGAEGHGRYTTGGRGGKVVHVTNLNDSGAGSLRAAVKGDSKKTVVFDVSGYIDLQSDLEIGANTTIAGQTAPGQGVTVRYWTIKPKGNNIIIRFIRFRRSQVKNVNDGADAITARYFTNMILDHCSMSWSIDELASFYDNRDFTMQWCVISEALNSGHEKGEHSYGGIWGGKNASFHHNFLSNANNRMPRFCGARYAWDGYDKAKYANTVDAERVDFRNCVIYNWGSGGCYGGPGGGYINIVNNYYKAGPGTKNKTRITQVTVATSGNADKNHPELYGLASRYFIDGNHMTAAANPETFDNWSSSAVVYDSGLAAGPTGKFIKDPGHQYGPNVEYMDLKGTDCVELKLNAEVDPGEVSTHKADKAYEKILDYAGASLYRDGADARYMEEARTGTVTYTGKVAGIADFVNDPEKTEDPSLPSFPELTSETRPAGWDTDGDGMPDAWETANGLNPNDANDGKTYTLDGKGYYTNLEVYLNSIVEHIMKAGTEDALTAVNEYWPEAGQSGIGDITAPAGEVDHIEYYNLNGIRLAEPAQGINIRRSVYTDGTVVTDKVLK